MQHCRKSKYVSSGRPCSTTTSLSGAFVSRLLHCRKSKYVASSRPCSTTTCSSGAFIIKPRSTADQSASGFTLRTPATRCAFRQHSATLVDSSRQLPTALLQLLGSFGQLRKRAQAPVRPRQDRAREGSFSVGARGRRGSEQA